MMVILLVYHAGMFNDVTRDSIKSVNLKYITVRPLDNDMIIPPSDGPMFILIILIIQ